MTGMAPTVVLVLVGAGVLFGVLIGYSVGRSRGWEEGYRDAIDELDGRGT